MKSITREFALGHQNVRLETGHIARQASGSVVVRIGDTIVLANCVAEKQADTGKDFFPLRVDYQERTYAAGKIPGGFFRREGRPSEKETLTSRLIDRPLRPLFPKGFCNEIQVTVTVLSLDPEVDPDVPALIGASAAVSLSGAPFNGPMGAVRVGYRDNRYLLNPTFNELGASRLNLVVAGTRDSVLMVESEADQLSEDVMLGAVMYGHQQMQEIISQIESLAAEAGTPAWEAPLQARDEALAADVAAALAAPLGQAYAITDKLERRDRVAAARDACLQRFTEQLGEGEGLDQVPGLISAAEKNLVRSSLLETGKRIDGRSLEDVRPIDAQVDLLPRVHGSALFTRGETQALVTCTIGTDRDAQIIDAIEGEYRDRFMLHYNFPPYCVGETGFIGSPKRREIGHGRLAKRALVAVMPDEEQFPYVLRVVSEITESNGSSSMATVCGTSLALMAAGVPTRAPVAGIAMGLVKEGDRCAVLSDIMGDEDHLGDMDFKVAGTAEGVTALQMDIKVEGITEAIMQQALVQARRGRLHILERMNAVISTPSQEMSEYAPRVLTIKIDPERIRDVIGKGGSTIRAITEQTGTVIDISDDGTVKISSHDKDARDRARDKVEQLTTDIKVGSIYEGRVVKLMDFGAFVTILPGKDGLVHISQISHNRVEQVSDYLNEGDTVRVKVLEVDRQGRVRLSMKAVGGEQQ